jgi:hypothetical protein
VETQPWWDGVPFEHWRVSGDTLTISADNDTETLAPGEPLSVSIHGRGRTTSPTGCTFNGAACPSFSGQQDQQPPQQQPFWQQDRQSSPPRDRRSWQRDWRSPLPQDQRSWQRTGITAAVDQRPGAELAFLRAGPRGRELPGTPRLGSPGAPRASGPAGGTGPAGPEPPEVREPRAMICPAPRPCCRLPRSCGVTKSAPGWPPRTHKIAAPICWSAGGSRPGSGRRPGTGDLGGCSSTSPAPHRVRRDQRHGL